MNEEETEADRVSAQIRNAVWNCLHVAVTVAIALVVITMLASWVFQRFQVFFKG